jgi:two-component system chemotaxis response regulator CheY
LADYGGFCTFIWKCISVILYKIEVISIKRVLIVDDALFIRNALKMMLENNGFEVAGLAQNGAEAITKYQELRPDIVTMDITMPDMDGIQSLREIMKLDSSAVVIMISAMGQESAVRESILAGAKNFVVKPFKEEQVIKTLGKF